MPLLKHAKKKQRQDIKRTLERKKLKTLYKQMIKKAKENPTPETISSAFKAIDKAAKKNLMHDNKAAHLKSSVSKASSSTPTHQTPAPKKHLTKAAQAKANKTLSSKSAPTEEVALVSSTPSGKAKAAPTKKAKKSSKK